MEPWVIWLIAAVLLAAGEIATLGLFLAPFAVGALVAAVLSALGIGMIVTLVAFLIVSILVLFGLRPIARSHRYAPARIRTGTQALIGTSAMVIERIDNNQESGAVRLGGEIWTARAYEEGVTIDTGNRVEVVEIRGATALVTT